MSLDDVCYTTSFIDHGTTTPMGTASVMPHYMRRRSVHVVESHKVCMYCGRQSPISREVCPGCGAALFEYIRENKHGY